MDAITQYRFTNWVSALQIAFNLVRTSLQPEPGTRMAMWFAFDPTLKHQVWRYATPFLVHVHEDSADLVISLFGQWLFGRSVERIYGWRGTAIIYLVGGITASVVESLWSASCLPVVGPSGAIYALAGAQLAAAVVRGLNHPTVGRKLTYFNILCLCFELLPPCSFFHLGGMAGGFVLGSYLMPPFDDNEEEDPPSFFSIENLFEQFEERPLTTIAAVGFGIGFTIGVADRIISSILS